MPRRSTPTSGGILNAALVFVFILCAVGGGFYLRLSDEERTSLREALNSARSQYADMAIKLGAAEANMKKSEYVHSMAKDCQGLLRRAQAERDAAKIALDRAEEEFDSDRNATLTSMEQERREARLTRAALDRAQADFDARMNATETLLAQQREAVRLARAALDVAQAQFDARLRETVSAWQQRLRKATQKGVRPSVQSERSAFSPADQQSPGRQAWADWLVKTSGEGWAMWDGSSVIGNSSSACEWHVFKPAASLNASRMCLYPVQEDVYVSGAVAMSGHWPDCNMLPAMWREHSKPGDVYVEVGANIGTCVMEMLMSTDAPIVAFEPEPSNLFHLSSTLAALDPSVRGRVALFPVGLGAAASSMPIFQSADNRGNSMVMNVSVGSADNSTATLPQSMVPIETLDGILRAPVEGGGKVALVKMDTQGFECNAMDGGVGMLSGAQVLKTEVAQGVLVSQGCSAEGLVERIRGAGFSVTLPTPLPAEVEVVAVRAVRPTALG